MIGFEMHTPTQKVCLAVLIAAITFIACAHEDTDKAIAFMDGCSKSDINTPPSQTLLHDSFIATVELLLDTAQPESTCV